MSDPYDGGTIPPTTPIFDQTVTATAVHVDAEHDGSAPADQRSAAADTAKQTAGTAADAAKDTAGAAKEQAQQVGSTAKDAGARVGATAKDQASRVASDAVGQAKELYGQATEQLSDQAGKQQKNAASALHTLGRDLGRMHEKDEEGGLAAELVQNVSQRAGRVADWLEAREPGEVVDEVRRFAARRPGLFIGLAAVTGVVAARAVKALTADAKPATPATSETGSHPTHGTLGDEHRTPDHVLGQPIAAFDSAADPYGPAHAGDAR